MGASLPGLLAAMLLAQVGCTPMAEKLKLAAEPGESLPGPRSGGWAECGPGLGGALGSLDVRYGRYARPSRDAGSDWRAAAWRGERTHAQFLLWSKDGVKGVRLEISPLTGKGGTRIEPPAVRAYFVRYVGADGEICGDILDPCPAVDLPPRTVRPVWLSIDVPPRAVPGEYRGTLTAGAPGAKPVVFDLELEVMPNVLSPPGLWSFHLDLWQNPVSAARYHKLKLWSRAHFKKQGELLRLLAQAGQKCLTATIVHRPWGGQTHDPYPSMVEWTRDSGGRWRFDYSLFDRYVKFGRECGITGSINCYSIVPWGGIRYYDAKAREYRMIDGRPGENGYREPVAAFLRDFSAHLKKMGWFSRTVIAMDERPAGQMRKALEVIREAAPGMKVALAGADHPELYGDIHDYCFFISHRVPKKAVRRRLDEGKPTTFYVCCGPRRPNTFTFSPPAEAAWLGWFAAARGYNGFLRWAYNSWTEDPLSDTSYPAKDWPAGDCFLVYPGPRSSIRFERLREGIQDFEKLAAVRASLEAMGAAGRPHLEELEAALARFDYPDCGDDRTLAASLNRAKGLLERLSRLTARP